MLLVTGMFSFKGRIVKEHSTREIKGSNGEERRGKWGRGYSDSNIWMEFCERGSLQAE